MYVPSFAALQLALPQTQIPLLLQTHLWQEQSRPKRSKEVIVPTNLFWLRSFPFLDAGTFSRDFSRSLESLCLFRWGNRWNRSDLETHWLFFICINSRSFDLIRSFIINWCLCNMSFGLDIVFFLFVTLFYLYYRSWDCLSDFFLLFLLLFFFLFPFLFNFFQLPLLRFLLLCFLLFSLFLLLF